MNATATAPTATRPGWFTIVAIAALLWNLFGVAMFTMQYTLSPEALAALPPEQRALFAAMPGWTWAAYGVAVGTGALGSLMLLLRRRAATWLLALSLAAIAVQFAWQAVLSEAVALLGPVEALSLPVFILAVAAALVWFAQRAARRGWIA